MGNSSFNNAFDGMEELATLYRAVSPDEFYSIMSTGEFSISAKGADVKYFGKSLDEVLEYANAFPDYAAIIEVKVPKDLLESITDFTHVDSSVFREGTVIITAPNLEMFNNTITEILQAY